MSMQSDFEDRLRKFEEEGVPLSNEEMAWYEQMKIATKAKGEIELRKSLESYYLEYKEDRKNKKVRYSIVGVAASIVLGLVVFYGFQSNSSHPVLLQDNQPVFSDSASYDSARFEHMKQTEKDSVDNED